MAKINLIIDSLSYHSKFELLKMKVFICISVIQHLSPHFSVGERFQTFKKCILCLASKNAKNLECLKCILVCLCHNGTKILNILYESIYFVDGFLVPPVMNRLIRLMFMATL